MTEYNLQYRVLSKEEKLLLFGNSSISNPINILKAKNLKNYLELYEKIYNGESVILPDFVNEKDPLRIYIYCGEPAGSKYYSEYNSITRACNFIYDTPFSYTKYYANNLFIPAINKAIELFKEISTEEIKQDNKASDMYQNVSINYSNFLETLQSGMFLNLYRGRVISATSYKAFSFSPSDRVSNLLSLSQNEIDTIYNKLTFNLPTKIINKDIVEKIEAPLGLIHNTSSFISDRNRLITLLAPIFSWSEPTSITLGHDFINLSGFVYTEDTVYTLLGSYPNKSPLNISYNTSSFTKAFDEVMSSKLTNDSLNLEPIFNFSNSSKRSYSTSNLGGSFVFINEDSLSTTETSRSLGVEEYIELNTEFINSVKQIYYDNSKVFSNSSLRDKFIKTEFASKSMPMISEIEVINRRYIPIKNKDKKLLLLSKTSLAKEATRKTAITRKISTAMTPIIDMAVRLFSIRDFETGMSKKKYNFKCSIVEGLNLQNKYKNGNTIFNKFSNPEETSTDTVTSSLFIEFMKQLTEFNKNSVTKIKETAVETISDLYNDTSYEGTPFKVSMTSMLSGFGYRTPYTRLSSQQQIFGIFKYLLGNFYDSFFSTGLMDTNYFSPASGMLNIFKVSTNLYSNAQEEYFKDSEKYLCAEAYSYTKLTGKALYYLYSNNFLSTDQSQADELEKRKNDNYISLANELIPSSNCFAYQQDVLDTFTALKKSKTFTDYYTWFKNIRPTLEAISNDIFSSEELAIYELNKLFFEQSEQMLQQLSLLETPYLPVEVPKKRCRKAKEVAIINTEEVTDLTEGEESGEPGTTNEQS